MWPGSRRIHIVSTFWKHHDLRKLSASFIETGSAASCRILLFYPNKLSVQDAVGDIEKLNRCLAGRDGHDLDLICPVKVCGSYAWVAGFDIDYAGRARSCGRGDYLRAFSCNNHLRQVNRILSVRRVTSHNQDARAGNSCQQPYQQFHCGLFLLETFPDVITWLKGEVGRFVPSLLQRDLL